MAERSLRFDLIARDKSFSKTLDQAGRKGQKLNQQLTRNVGGAGDKAGRQFSAGLNKRLGGGFSLATRTASLAAGAIGAAFAAVQIGQFLKGAIDEAREAAKVGRQTNAVIKATGGVANVTAKDVDRLTAGLMRKVAVDDDVIATGANMILTFKGVRNEVGKGNNIFDQATVAALDMTAAMNKGEITQEGLQSSSIRLGRALNDPIKGVTALTRVGVTFTEGQKKQIKALVEAGDKMGAQKIILKELQSEFGGAAKAAVDPWQRVGVVMGEVKEQIGTALLPVLEKVATWLSVKIPQAVAAVAGALQDAGHWWSENRYEIDLIVKSLSTGFTPAVDKAADSTGRAGGSLQTLAGALSLIAEGIARVSQGWNLLIIASQSVSWAFGNLVQAIGHTANAIDFASKGFGLFGDKVGHAGDSLVALGSELEGKAVNAINNARVGIDQASTAISGLQAHTADAAKVANDHATALRNEKLAIDGLKSALEGEETAELDVRQAKLNVSSAQKRLTELTGAGKKGSLEYRQAVIDLKRAKIDLKAKTDAYRASVAKTTDKERTAASATTRAGNAAHGAGKKAAVSNAQWRRFGEQVDGVGGKAKTTKAALDRLKSKKIAITGVTSMSFTKNFTAKDWAAARIAAGAPGSAAKGARITQGSGPTADDVPIWVSKGEAVVPAHLVPAVAPFLGAHGVPGFSLGGKIDQTGQAYTGVGKIMDRAGTLQMAALIKSLVGGGGSAAIKAFIKSTDALPYVWGAAGPSSYDCSGLVGAVYGRMRGDPRAGHGRRYFTTGSIGGFTPGLSPGLGGTLQIGVTAGSGHMAGRYGGLGFEAESSRTGIKIGGAASRPESFARRFHMAKGGKIDPGLIALLASTGADIGGDPGKLRVNGKVFDAGGTLSPGLNLVDNRTGRPEPLVPAGGPARVEVTVNLNGVILSDSRAARDLADRLEPHIRNAVLRQERRR